MLPERSMRKESAANLHTGVVFAFDDFIRGGAMGCECEEDI
jgi:hypothetical protein